MLRRVNWRASPLHTALVAVANSIVQLASAYGAHMTAQQNAAITSLCNSLLMVASLTVVYVTNNGNGRPPA